MENKEIKTLLLAEDDDSMRRLLEVILKKGGYEVLTAEDGLQAIKMALENEISAIVADAIMPGLTGYELCRMIKSRADKKNVPFIILSGLTISDEESSKCSADVFLSKTPELKTELLETIKKLL